MDSIKKIGAYARESRTVTVDFEFQGVQHRRQVNACLNARGQYDRAATRKRVEAVARGVEAKIACGAIANAPEPAAPAELPEPADSAGD